MNPKINENIKSWWSQLPDELKGRFPTFVHNLDPNAEILFVGFNPAGSLLSPPKDDAGLTQEIIKQITEDEKKLIGFWGSRKESYKKHYSVFHKIIDDLKVSCEYVDVFQVRCSDSEHLLKLMKKKGEFIEVHKNHLYNFELVVKELPNLKFILFNNVNSSKLIKEHYGTRMSFDDEVGLYKISEPREIYFQFQGSMQYGRSTEYDQERIRWFFGRIK